MSQASILDVEVSLMRTSDLAFVASGWKRSHADAPQNTGQPSPVVFARLNRQVDELLDRPTVAVFVARDREHPDTLLGFLCMEHRGPVLALHYAYTRRTHKRLGVCTELLKAALQGAQDCDVLVYTAGSRFDWLWERWGFLRVDLHDWLRDSEAAVKKLTGRNSAVKSPVKTQRGEESRR
ncbi:MAG TPA: GNAT family N-acetyltransferase [Polyangiales bacterium]